MAIAAVVRVGDTSSHGGHVITGAANMTANGVAVARDQDLHVCPLFGHGTTPITATSTSVFVNQRAIARTGDRAACGAILLAGSPTMSAG